MSQQFTAVPREPNESVREWKRRSIWCMAKLVATFALSFAKLGVEAQVQVTCAFEMWAEEKKQVILNPGRVVLLNCCGNITFDEAIAMASELIAGVSEWFLCRHIIQVDCRRKHTHLFVLAGKKRVTSQCESTNISNK